MIYQLGRLLGSAIVVLYGLTVMNYVVKFINKKFRNTLKKNPTFFKGYNIFVKIIVKNHPLFGLLTILVLLSHFLIQFNYYGLNISGAIAAGIMILQVALGIYGSKTKKRGGTWLTMHRTIAVILLIAILIHIN